MSLPEFPITAPIQIAPYQKQWPFEFDSIRQDLDDLLGPLALRIDHIGSTSIPDLAAKDIIDIQITVADLFSVELLTRLQNADYELKANYRDELEGLAEDHPQLAKHFMKNKSGGRRANIHVRQAGYLNQEYALLFRDYLRCHAFERDVYCKIKQRLSEIFPSQIEGYLYIKDPVMDLLYNQAKRWAKQTNWQGAAV